MSSIESRFKDKVPDFKVLPGEKYFPWIVRHAAWLLTRYLIKKDSNTPYERLRGRQYNGEIVEPFEFTHFRLSTGERGKLDSQTSTRVWLYRFSQSLDGMLCVSK